MAQRPGASEYGGEGGIIQSHPDHGEALDNLANRKAVREAAMIERRAGIMEANGILKHYEEIRNPDGTFTIVKEPYDLEQAREDLEKKR